MDTYIQSETASIIFAMLTEYIAQIYRLTDSFIYKVCSIIYFCKNWHWHIKFDLQEQQRDIQKLYQFKRNLHYDSLLSWFFNVDL